MIQIHHSSSKNNQVQIGPSTWCVPISLLFVVRSSYATDSSGKTNSKCTISTVWVQGKSIYYLTRQILFSVDNGLSFSQLQIILTRKSSRPENEIPLHLQTASHKVKLNASKPELPPEGITLRYSFECLPLHQTPGLQPTSTPESHITINTATSYDFGSHHFPSVIVANAISILVVSVVAGAVTLDMMFPCVHWSALLPLFLFLSFLPIPIIPFPQ